jgi:hypothetical protein
MRMDLIDFAEKVDDLSDEELYTLMSEVSGYTKNPVSIDEFIDDPEFLKPFLQDSIYPYWRKEFRKIYPSPHFSPYWLVCLRGSIGAGKSTIACVGIAYDLYKLLCLRSPQREYKLVPTDKIVFSLINRTLTLSSDVIWSKLSQMFMTSPFFTRLIGSGLTRKKSKDDTLFPNRIDFVLGSRVGHTLGMAVHSAIISEANFSVIEDQMYDVFNSLIRRMESRFMGRGGVLPGKVWLDSSESDKFSVVNKIVDSYKHASGVYVSQRAIWEVKPIPYSGEKFWVYCGSDVRRADIINEQNKFLITQEPENCIEVPIEYQQSFEADLGSSIRDIAGRSTVSSMKLFRLRDKLAAACNVTMLFPEAFQLDFDNDGDQIFDYAQQSKYFTNPVNSHVPRYIHIDIGISGDRLGIAASYVAGFTDRKYRDPNTMQDIVDNVPLFVTEWAFGIEPRPGKQIPLFKVRGFVIWLSRQGYPIAEVTCDGFQSTDLLQILTKEGFNTQVISVDRTVEPYTTMRSIIYEGRGSIPANSILQRELIELDISSDGKKCDHPEKGSKDIADAVAGSMYNASVNAGKARLFHSVVQTKTEDQKLASMFWPDKD